MTSGPAVRCAAVLAAALAWIAETSAQHSEPLRVLSSNGVRAAIEALEPQCERSIGHSVAIEYGTSASIQQRVASGERLDVALGTTEVVVALAKGGHLASESIAPLGRAGIGLGVRAGTHHYKIGTAEEIKQTLLDARSVAYAQDGASRPHIERMFERLGIAEQMKAKAVLEQGSVRAAAKVVGGEAEILLTLVSEILPVQGMELLGALPAEFQSYISFDAAVAAKPADPALARALLACVAAPAAAPTFAAKGIER